MDITNLLQEIQSKAKHIKASTNYWMVRSMGGSYYSDYYHNNFIAIGYDKVTLLNLKEYYNTYDNPKDVIQAKLINEGMSKKVAHYPASQIMRFYNDMKVGDIVIVPNVGGGDVAIGKIVSEVYEGVSTRKDDGDEEYPLCPFKKRRKIEWIKTISKWNLNPKVFPLFNSRHIITNINDYSIYLNESMSSYYVEGVNETLVLNVKTQKSISAKDFSVISDLLTLVDLIAEAQSMPISSRDIKIRACVQSPGDIVLICAVGSFSLTAIGLIILAACGGGLRSKKENEEYSLKTDGFIKAKAKSEKDKAIANLVNVAANKLQGLEVQTPSEFKDIVQGITELNRSSENED